MTAAEPLRTGLTELTGIRYPIVQIGMGFVAGARLTAATSMAGGLGVIGSATMTLEHLRTTIISMQQRTQAPFGVNLRAACCARCATRQPSAGCRGRAGRS